VCAILPSITQESLSSLRPSSETNLDDVMQISNVFVNVSKGEVAKTNDLQKAFGTSEVSVIVKEILKKGEVQVGEKERDHDLTSLRKEIATLVSEKCVDPTTQRPYPVGMIEKAMGEAGYSVKQNKSAKSQVSECIKQIQTESKLPIQRARMRIRVALPTGDGQRLREKILEGAEKVEKENIGDEEWDAVMLIDPGQFRLINDLLQKECKGKGRIETILFAATAGS
jgi:ribosome maturation protein SDO1